MIRKAIPLLLIGYYMLLAYWMLFGFNRTAGNVYMYNLQPFTTIGEYAVVTQDNLEGWIVNVLGNIVVFVPFGLLIPAATRLSTVKAYALFIASIAILELIQLFTMRGSLDVDDLILNTVGYFIGIGILKIVLITLRRRYVSV